MYLISSLILNYTKIEKKSLKFQKIAVFIPDIYQDCKKSLLSKINPYS